MWIRSRDKTMVVYATKLIVIPKDNLFAVGMSPKTILGAYKTKIEAMAVVAMLFQTVQKGSRAFDMPTVDDIKYFIRDCKDQNEILGLTKKKEGEV
jgi:hypothetical protein